MELNVAEDGGFDSGKREEEVWIEVGDGSGFGGFGAGSFAVQMRFGLDPREGEGNGFGVAEAGEGVDPGTAWVAKTKQLGDLVVGFACGVVEGAADELVAPGAVCGLGEVQVRMTSGDDKGKGGLVLLGSGGSVLALFEEDGVNMAFEVVDGDDGEIAREGEGLGVGDSDEECAGEAGAGGDGNGVEVVEADGCFSKCRADHGNDGAEMLAAGELGDHSAEAGMRGDLRGYDGRERA